MVLSFNRSCGQSSPPIAFSDLLASARSTDPQFLDRGCGKEQLLVSIVACSYIADWGWFLRTVAKYLRPSPGRRVGCGDHPQPADGEASSSPSRCGGSTAISPDSLCVCVNWVPETCNSEDELPVAFGVGSQVVECSEVLSRTVQSSVPSGSAFEVVHIEQRGGLMHAKLMLLEFGPFLRVVVTSANLTADDWEGLAQCVWMCDVPLLQRGNTDAERSGAATELFVGDLRRCCTELGIYHRARPLLDRCDWAAVATELRGVRLLLSRPGGDPTPLEELAVLASPAQRHLSSCGARMRPVVYQASSVGGMNDAVVQRFTAVATAGGDTEDQEDHSSSRLRILFPSLETVRHQLSCGNLGAVTLRCFARQGSFAWSCMRDLPCSGAITFHSKVMFRCCNCEEATCSSGGASRVAWVLAGSHNFTADCWGRRVRADGRCTDARNFELSVFVDNTARGGGGTQGDADQTVSLPTCFFSSSSDDYSPPATASPYEPFVFLKHKRMLLEEGQAARHDAQDDDGDCPDERLFHWNKFLSEASRDDGRH